MSVSWWIGTACGAGRLPKAPGTWASVIAALLYGFFFPATASLLLQALFFFTISATFFAGVWAGQQLEIKYGHDPSIVVVDEIVGMWIALLWIPPVWTWILPAIVLFRVFDVTKWLGAGAAQKLSGGWGIMLDDVVAGIWSNVILQIIRWLWTNGH